MPSFIDSAFAQEHYKRIYFFTRNEKLYYPVLKAVNEERGFLLYPKVRLSDLVRVKAEILQRYTDINPNIEWFDIPPLCRIMSKHVDFCVYSPHHHKVVLVIELDGKDHLSNKKYERDVMVDSILKECKIKTLHLQYSDLRNNNDHLEEYLDRRLKELFGNNLAEKKLAAKPLSDAQRKLLDLCSDIPDEKLEKVISILHAAIEALK